MSFAGLALALFKRRGSVCVYGPEKSANFPFTDNKS